MPNLIRTQRLLAGVGIAISLIWAGLTGVPVVGLWFSVWMLGLTSAGLGTVLHEWEKRHHRDQDLSIRASRAGLLMVSGFGYLVVGMLAGWFHPVITVVALVISILDFGAGYPIARTLLRISTSDDG